MYFGSDNQTGASEQVLATLLQANEGLSSAYGDDEWTQKAKQMLQAVFECEADIYFVSTGTAANALALSCMVKPWDSVLCHSQAHIINDELTAPEFFSGGARLVGIEATQAKLSASGVAAALSAYNATHPPHNSIAKVLSLTQLTESGQAYTVDELKSLTALAHQQGLSVHMDGARFANALVALDCSPAEMSWKAGVDVLSLGATKNGALSAEAVIFFDKTLAENFVAQRKRSGHLISKSRWLGAQFVAWLAQDHWLTLARNANHMAAQLNRALSEHPDYDVVWPVAANQLFVIMNKAKVKQLHALGAVFYEWPAAFLPPELSLQQEQRFVRLVASFCTQQSEVDNFIAAL